jgi:acetyl esterase/lipase
MILLCIAAAIGEPAISQDARTYDTVRHPERFEIDWAGFYADADERSANLRARLRVHSDLAYGDETRQRLDLYLPAEATSPSPVFLFLHGGGFKEGDRVHYGFIAESFSKHGVITAVASYRLADVHHYPAQAEDARAAVRWIWRHAASYGGDPEAIYVGGHSAGGILAADLGTDRGWMAAAGIPAHALRGIVPISGVYDFRSDWPGYVTAYAPTPALRARASPLATLRNPVPNAVVAAGSAEESIVPAARELAAALSEEGVRTALLILPGENHRDTVLSLADDSDELFRAVLRMMAPGRDDP